MKEGIKLTKRKYKIISVLIFILFYLIPVGFACRNIVYGVYIEDTSESSNYTNQNDTVNKGAGQISTLRYEPKKDYIPTITIDRTEYVVEYRYIATDKEFEEFVRVVEAEVTGENPFSVGYEEAFKSKLRVAQVILNRIESPHFPNTMRGVIFQKNAFTPLLDGRYYEVEISQVTIDACRAALLESTPDLTSGCEFFSSGTKTCKYGSYNFTDSVGHSFFNSYRNK